MRVLLAAVALLLTSCGQPAERPNVLLVLLDDFGVNDLAAGPTPRLQAIAEAGVSFSRHYSESVCAPGRAALLTSRPAASVGFHTYRAGLSAKFDTLPEQFRAGGYRTFFLGKWHLGHAFPEARPEQQGFDRWFGMLEAIDTVAREDGGGARSVSYFDPWLEDESGSRKAFEGHLTDLLADRAIDYLQGAEQPWFLQLALLAPHTPIMPSPTFAERFPDTDEGRYLALLAQADGAIGRVLDALPDGGRNTIVVITSDNGGTNRDFANNEPFSGRKGELSEGGLRTPLLLHWPGHWQGGKSLPHVVSIVDIGPTLLRAAGLSPGDAMQGRDLFDESPRALYWYQQTIGMEQGGMLSPDGDWRLLDSSLVGRHLMHRDGFRGGEGPAPDTRIETEMTNTLWRWVEKATRVDPEVQRKDNGWQVSGDEFRRTPALGPFSLGLALRRGEGEDGVLLEQKGFLRAELKHSNALQLWFDDHSAEITLPELSGDCHSLAITAFLAKARGRASFRKPDSELAVYLDGEAIYSASYRNQDYAEASPTEPLLVTADPDALLYAPAAESVEISTRRLGAAGISRQHKRLVEVCQASME